MYIAFKENDTIAVYYHAHKLDMKQVFSRKLPVAFGKYKNRTFTLMTLFVPEHMRLQGIGGNLIIEIAKECDLVGCRRIDVDDMSDRSFKPNNIYVKYGFRYLNVGYPEMYTSPKNILSRIHEFNT
jgi:GNAT superfamily N-acetyltransferase